MDAGEPTKHDHSGFDLAVKGALLDVPPVWSEPSVTPPPPSIGPTRRGRRLLSGPIRLAKPVVLPTARRIREFLTRDALAQQHEIGLDSARRSDELAARLTRIEGALDRLGDDLRGMATTVDTLGATVHSITPAIAAAASHAEIAARRVVIPLADALLVRTSLGYVLCSSDDPGSLTYLVEAGEWEPGTRAVLERLLVEGATFVDIGANLGLHSLAAARAVGASGRVIAVEPFDRTAGLLAQTLQLNGYSDRTEVHRCALSREAGRGRLYLGPSSGEHSLLEDSSARSVDVEIATLDGVLAGRRANVVKIDVEGAEIDVLEGGVQALCGDVVVVVEFGPSHLRRRGLSVDEWVRRFTDHGFAIQVIDESSGSVRELRHGELKAVTSTNLVMARRDSKAWEQLRTSG